MHHSIFSILFILTLFTSCKNEKAIPAVPPVTLSTATFVKSSGRDCAKMDDTHNHCVQIDLAWPEVKTGSEPLKKSVATWAADFLVGLLVMEAPDSASAQPTVAAAAQSFIQSHDEWSKEATESPLGNWVVEAKDTVLLNDGKHLTLQISAYNFTGGAHGMPFTLVSSFEVATGKQLLWADLVTDTIAVQVLAEKKFRQERADIFKSEKEGGADFKFDETFPFVLPVSYGLTSKGIYCHYQHYEVTPYAFGSTGFVLTFEELGALMKK